VAFRDDAKQSPDVATGSVDPKAAERAYFKNIGESGIAHSLRKPFADETRGRLLMEFGAVLSLLPPPPARLLDLGCGSGWTSSFFARSGYEVLGVDLSPEAIVAARREFQHPGLSFVVGDYEDARFATRVSNGNSFDAAVFFDSLHHASDETAALRAVLGCLRDGGVVVLCQPGAGHAESATSKDAVKEFGVAERDMPPKLIASRGRSVGFRSAEFFAHPHEIHRHLYVARPRTTYRERLLASRLGQILRLARADTQRGSSWGLVRLTK